jgi:NADPH:quinone reductase-like Zn-dependent oxidoreductase
MAVKPNSMRFEEAATLPVGGINALHFLRKGDVREETHVLINGAGGSIGTYGIQLAKSYGAEVTAVDSTEKLEMLRSIGADHVIDYTQEDFTKKGDRWDVIIDVVGKSHFSRSIRCLKPYGRYVLGNPRLPGMIRGIWTSLTSNKRVVFELATPNAEDFRFLASLFEQGKIKSIIDRRYPLEKVAEAHLYVETEKKMGNVIVTIIQK